MVRQRGTVNPWIRVAIAAAAGALYLSAPIAWSQKLEPKLATANTVSMAASVSNGSAGDSTTESGIPPKAMRLYRRAVQELYQGKAAQSEKDALRAVKLDAKFADADALAATAALSQNQFERGRVEAEVAVRIDSADEKAWVILATADNYLGKYTEADEALSHVRQQDQATWQVAYQRARAEAGQGDAQRALDWANRAALTAPPNFAPLHLLRASALLAANQKAQAANELELYLQLPGGNPSERQVLTQQLRGLRELANPTTGYNALAN